MSVVTEPIMLDTTGQALVTALSQITAMQGPAGADGVDGVDGVSPTVTVTTITGGHRITITDASGAHSFDVMDGEGGSEHIYNVKDYGAKGNWVTDDYDAIMAAIADAQAHPAMGGGTHATVYFPAGKYYISQGIRIDEDATPISIIGESSASVTITGSMSGALLTLYRTDSASSSGSTISGLTLQATSSTTEGLVIEKQSRCVVEDVVLDCSVSASEGYGLVVDHSERVFFSHIQERGFYKGCYIDNPQGMEDVYFSDCRFDDNVGTGFEAHDVHGLYLTNVTMHANGSNGLMLGAPFLSAPPYCPAENIFLNNVGADTSAGMNCAIYWADHVMMSNCLFAKQLHSPTSADTHGLYIEHSKNITISASTFRDNYDSGIYAVYSDNLSISGCVLRKNGQRSAYTYAIDLALCNDITVTNNLFVPEGEQERGVILGDCDYYIVTNNIFDGATTGVYVSPEGAHGVVENNLE